MRTIRLVLFINFAAVAAIYAAALWVEIDLHLSVTQELWCPE